MKITALAPDFCARVEPMKEKALDSCGTEQVVDLLKRFGAIAFMGFGAAVDTFTAFTARFGTDCLTYRGGGYARRCAGDGRDPTLLSVSFAPTREGQPGFPLPLHGEMYYLDVRPAIMWFYCRQPADSGGELILCDGPQVYDALSDSARALLASKRLKYIRRYGDGEWQQIYQTDDLEAAAHFAEANGLEVTIDRERSAIRTEYLHSAFGRTRWSARPAYINNMMAVLRQEAVGRDQSLVRFEDGSRLPEDLVAEISTAQAANTIEIPMRSGDVVLLDNSRAMHGRRAFRGGDRQIYVRMLRSVAF